MCLTLSPHIRTPPPSHAHFWLGYLLHFLHMLSNFCAYIVNFWVKFFTLFLKILCAYCTLCQYFLHFLYTLCTDFVSAHFMLTMLCSQFCSTYFVLQICWPYILCSKAYATNSCECFCVKKQVEFKSLKHCHV